MLYFKNFFKPIVWLTQLIGLPDYWTIRSNRLTDGIHLFRGLLVMAIVLGVVGHCYWGLLTHANNGDKKMRGVDIFIDAMLWCASAYPSMITHLVFVFKKRPISTFFATWERLYVSGRINYFRCSHRRLFFVCGLYAIMGISSCILVVIFTALNPSPGLLTYEPHFSTGFPYCLALLLHTFQIVYCWVFLILAEVGIGAWSYFLSLSFAYVNEKLNTQYQVLPSLRADPPFVFDPTMNHASLPNNPSAPCDQESSSEDIKMARKRSLAATDHGKAGGVEKIRTAWLTTESVVRLVSDLNDLFGLVILVTQAGQFLLACVLGYTAIRRQSVGGAVYFSYLVNFVIMTTKIICFNCLCSSIHNEYEKLQLTVSGLAGLAGEDKTLHCFVNRLHGRSVCLSPFGLYAVNNSTLLAMFTALLTYLIVLLQSASL